MSPDCTCFFFVSISYEYIKRHRDSYSQNESWNHKQNSNPQSNCRSIASIFRNLNNISFVTLLLLLFLQSKWYFPRTIDPSTMDENFSIVNHLPISRIKQSSLTYYYMHRVFWSCSFSRVLCTIQIT